MPRSKLGQKLAMTCIGTLGAQCSTEIYKIHSSGCVYEAVRCAALDIYGSILRRALRWALQVQRKDSKDVLKHCTCNTLGVLCCDLFLWCNKHAQPSTVHAQDTCTSSVELELLNQPNLARPSPIAEGPEPRSCAIQSPLASRFAIHTSLQWQPLSSPAPLRPSRWVGPGARACLFVSGSSRLLAAS